MSKSMPKIFHDFQNADAQGRLRLTLNGTMEDLSQQKVELREGLCLRFYADDVDDHGELDELLVDGVATYSEAEHCWVAVIDWEAIRHASETQLTPANGSAPTMFQRTQAGE